MTTTPEFYKMVRKQAAIVIPSLDSDVREYLAWMRKGAERPITFSLDKARIDHAHTKLCELSLLSLIDLGLTDLGMAVADLVIDAMEIDKRALEVISSPLGASASFKNERFLLVKIGNRKPIGNVPVLFFDLGLVTLGDRHKSEPTLVCTPLGERVIAMMTGVDHG